MAIMGVLPASSSFFYTCLVFILSFNVATIQAIQLPPISTLRSALGGDLLLTTSKDTQGPIFSYGTIQFKPYDFILEASLFGFCFFYLFISFLGKSRNKSLVSNWLKHSLPFLKQEFSVVANGEDGEKGEKSLWNGGGQAVVYATGRRSVQGMQALFTLIPVHDPFQLIFNFLSDIFLASTSSTSQDLLTLTFNINSPNSTPSISTSTSTSSSSSSSSPTSSSNGIFAICKKTDLRSFRKSRFDLTFSKVNESSDPLVSRNLDQEYVFMSETPELTDQILGETGNRGEERRNKIPLQKALNGIDGKIFKSLCLTDVWEEKPEEAATLPPLPPRRLILTLNLPKNQKEIQSSLNLISLSLNILDGFEKGFIKIRNDTCSKLGKIREEVKKELQDRWDRYDREEAEEARQKAKRDLEAAKLAKLSPAEQEKRKKVEQKRAMKKAQGKQMKAR